MGREERIREEMKSFQRKKEREEAKMGEEVSWVGLS